MEAGRGKELIQNMGLQNGKGGLRPEQTGEPWGSGHREAAVQEHEELGQSLRAGRDDPATKPGTLAKGTHVRVHGQKVLTLLPASLSATLSERVRPPWCVHFAKGFRSQNLT